MDSSYASFSSKHRAYAVRLVSALKDSSRISTADFLYLLDCVDAADPTIMALAPFMQVKESGHTVGKFKIAPSIDWSASSIEDQIDSLCRIAARWRRESDAVQSALLHHLNELSHLGVLLPSDVDVLQVLVLRRESGLLTPWSKYLSAGGWSLEREIDVDSFAAANRIQRQRWVLLRYGEHWSEFFESLQRIIDFHSDLFIDKSFPPLLNQLAPNLSAASQHYLTAMANSGDVSFLSAFAEYQATGAEDELSDTLIRLANRWRTRLDPFRRSLLLLLNKLAAAGASAHQQQRDEQAKLPHSALPMLESLVYSGDPVLLAAYEMYVASVAAGGHSSSWIEFWDSLTHIV